MPVITRPDRNPVVASFWQFDPTTEEEATVEAMPAALSVARSDDDLVMIAVRGKPTTRYETGDSVWLELTDSETLRLIERLAAALQRPISGGMET